MKFVNLEWTVATVAKVIAISSNRRQKTRRVMHRLNVLNPALDLEIVDMCVSHCASNVNTNMRSIVKRKLC